MTKEQLEAYELLSNTLELLRESEKAHREALNRADQCEKSVDHYRMLYQLTRNNFERLRQ
jgi:hypothetical protein